MSATRLRRGVIAVAAAGLALELGRRSARPLGAAVKLPSGGVETPSGGTVTRDREHAALPALQPLGRRVQRRSTRARRSRPPATGSGTGISEATNGTIDIGASDAYLSPSVVSANPHLKNIPTGDLGPAGGLQRPGRHRPPEAERQGALGDLPGHRSPTGTPRQIASANPGVTLPEHCRS